MAKRAAKGIILRVGDALISPTFTVIDYVKDITSTGGEADRIDVTTHDSPGNAREFVQGFKGERTAGVVVVYDPTNASHQLLASLFASGEIVPWELEMPQHVGADDITFEAYVSSFPLPGFPIDGAIEIEIGLQITGDPVFQTAP